MNYVYAVLIMLGWGAFVLLVMFGPQKRLRWVQRVYCRIGWHSYPSFTHSHHDGASQHAQCRWCYYHGMLDSHGQLF